MKSRITIKYQMASIDCQETNTTKFTKRGGNQAETTMDLHTQKTKIYAYVYTHPHPPGKEVPRNRYLHD